MSADGTTLSPVFIADAYAQPVVATWTSTTLLNTAVTVATGGMDCVALTVSPSGTITTGAITFEVYDGFNWFPIKSARESSYNTDSVFSGVGSPGQQAWTVPVAAYPQFRVRLSTALTDAGAQFQIAVITSSAPDTSVVTCGLDPLQSNHPGVAVVQGSPQFITVGAASVQSAAVGASTNRVFLTSTTGCYVAFGAAPTATAGAGSIYVPPNVVMFPISVTSGTTKIAVIQASAGGNLTITESL